MTTPAASLHILYVQKGHLAVDKPCGMSVHNDPGVDLISAVTEKIARNASLSASLGISAPDFKVQPVHRLDKETSGVMLLATDKDTLRSLSERFAAGQVKKKYLALVHGRFDPKPPSSAYHTWEFALSRQGGGRKNPAGKGRRVSCKTRYRVLEESVRYCLLEIELLTGRKHQIRRHAKLAGHPVAGDARYGSKRSIDYLRNILSYKRLGLHCTSLEFVAPGQEKTVCIRSQNPLTDMIRLLETDRLKT